MRLKPYELNPIGYKKEKRMSKSAIFTTAYAVAKESWDHFSEGVDFMEHIKNHLGHQLAERIFQEASPVKRS